MSVVFGIAIFSIIINPVLPRLGLRPVRALPQARNLLPPVKHKKHVPKSHFERLFQKSKRKLASLLPEKNLLVAGSKSKQGKKSQSQIIGFYVNWDDASFTSLKQNLFKIDKLMPEWLHSAKADGSLIVDDAAKVKETLAYIRDRRPNLPIVPLINNFSPYTQQWDTQNLDGMLSDPSAREKAIGDLLAFVKENNLAGVNIDYESLPASSQENLVAFMKELYARFHPLGLEVSQSLPLEKSPFDYRELAKYNDYLILMAYDEHSGADSAGPVASQDWYVNGLSERVSQLGAGKVVIAVGSYGYDWNEKTHISSPVSFQEAIKTAQESEGQIIFDPASLNPTYDYSDENNFLHHVWFLDAPTVFNQLKIGQSYGVRGYALWRLGSEDPAAWSVFEHRGDLSKAEVTALWPLQFGYGVDYEGKGEILKVTSVPHPGTRKIVYDKQLGLITGESVSSFFEPYTITRWGAQDSKKIALTFDDGPDSEFTSQVLGILERYRVPATFFIIGLNGELNPGLLQRIVKDGNEIGNHTFTHPDITAISEQQLKLEIDTTERLFESRLGLRSVLFRPPYSQDIEPQTQQQVKPLVLISNLGLYTIGMGIDPWDWSNPGAHKIAERTVRMAKQGQGNIVLLHDGGGDRSQTVEALPEIIKELRAGGFQLVLVSDLLGLKKQAVMPPIPRSELFMAAVNDTAFTLVRNVSRIFYYLFFAWIVLAIARFIFIGALAVSERFFRKGYEEKADYEPTVSVVVPAFNEERVICRTVRALLKSDFREFEIIVVDDGSTDSTYERLVSAFGQNPRVRIFTERNRGKAGALNFGVNESNADIIIALDADTVFKPETIAKLVRHFSDPKVGAVAGNAKVGNHGGLLTKWQALEYITCQNLDRRAFDVLNCILVVPGSVGAWRRDLILKAGGFSNTTLAEDADLTLTILRMGYLINYEDEAVAYTEAPHTVRSFVKQRFRWMFGTFQTAWKHKDAVFDKKYGALGMFAIPNVFVFQVFFPLISPVVDFLILGSLGWMIWQRFQHPIDYSADGFLHILFYYALFLAIDFCASGVAFLLGKEDDYKPLLWLFLQRFFYRQLMYYVAIKSVMTAIKGSGVSWVKIERRATVSQ